jgi:hypothetical protein
MIQPSAYFGRYIELHLSVTLNGLCQLFMKRNLFRHCRDSLGISKRGIHRVDYRSLVLISVLWNGPRGHQILHLYILFSGLKGSVYVLHCQVHYKNSRQDYRDLCNNWPRQPPKRMAEDWISVSLSSGFPCCSYWNLLSLTLFWWSCIQLVYIKWAGVAQSV